MKSYTGIIVRFIILVLVQVIVLNKIEFGDWTPYFNAFVYVMFILTLPFETPLWGLLLLSFLLGLSVDIFQGTYGMHASACLVAAFVRPAVLKTMSSTDEYEFRNVPTVQVMGLSWYVVYASVICLIHHLWLYLIEDFRFIELGDILLKTVCSTSISVVLIILAQYLIFMPQKENG